MIMKRLLMWLVLGSVVWRLDAEQVSLTVDTGASSFQFELCVAGTCDTETQSLQGSVAVNLDSDTPTQIALQDFDVQAMGDYNFLLNYGLLGRINAALTGLRVYHAEPEAVQPFFPITGDAFSITNVPFLTTGDGTYTASGAICSILQGQGQPCSTNFSLASLGTNYADTVDGTVQVSNNIVSVHISFGFSGPLDPNNPDLATITGTADIYASGKLLPGLVPLGSEWKYLDDGSERGTIWRVVGYNDGNWSTGTAELGYGDGDETTVINSGPANNHYITTYFRRALDVLDPSVYTNLFLRIRRDDGAIVYLNNVEIFRSNMPTGTVNSTTLASYPVTDAAETAFFGTAVDPARLRSGGNVLAVEVHQVAASSSDISFDLELLGNTTVTNTPPEVSIADPADGALVSAGQIPITIDATDPDGLVALVELFANGNKVAEAGVAPFGVVWTNTQPGTFTLTARVTDNYSLMTTSAPVTITVALPALSVGWAGSQLQLAWPAWASSYTLYSATNLSPPIMWEPASVDRESTNDQVTATLEVTDGAKFFRLEAP